MSLSSDSLESLLNPANWDSFSSVESEFIASSYRRQFLESRILPVDSLSASKKIWSFYDRLISDDSSPSDSGDWGSQLAEVKSSLLVLQRDLLINALTDSPVSNSHSESPVDYLDLSISSSDEELRTQQFNARDDIGPNLCKAVPFLAIPSLKSQEVALAILRGKDPFVITSSLGEGGCGVVKACTVLDQSYAAKSLKSADDTLFNKECRVPLSLDHPNLVKIYLINSDERTIFFEIAQKGSLKKCLASNSNTVFTREELLHVVQGISRGLSYMHSQGYIHGDIKPDNILITDTKEAKITDFGTCEKIEDFQGDAPTQGTAFYLPPEYLTGSSTKENCTKIDVWGFGMIIWHILKQEDFITPFVGPNTQGNDRRSQGGFRNAMSFTLYLADTFKGFPEGFLENQLDQAKLETYDPTGALTHLMRRCLCINPDGRPSMHDILTVVS